MGNEIVKLIFERKMSDAKDLIDETLNKKLAGVIGEGLEKVVSEKLDPVGKEDDDIDNDGDSDESDDYLRKRRKAIGKAMNTRKGMNEGAPDTELDHHRGKNPDIFDQDYLPMKKGGKTFKAKSVRSSGGY